MSATVAVSMTNNDAPRIALGPDSAPKWLADAIGRGGGQLVGLAERIGNVCQDEFLSV